MLRSRNLDNQTFDEIMEFILSRLPWICPGWTDYNAHDPGITILELMAWYKEMQQYHMNSVTEAMQKQLLKLIGVEPLPAHAANCYIELPIEAGERRELARMETDECIPFELVRSRDEGAEISAVFIEHNGNMSEVTDILEQPNISIMPFGRDADASLYIGFSQVSGSKLRIWFEIDDEYPISRNPFIDALQRPRVIQWTFVGVGSFEPELDETHALSIDGYVELQIPEGWSELELGGQSLKFICLSLLDPGCEEDVRLNGASANRYEAAQQETWSKLLEFTVLPESEVEITLTDALSIDGLLYAFIRTDAGLRQLEITDHYAAGGRTVVFDAGGAAQDGNANILMICADALHINEIVHPSTGLPDAQILLQLGGRKVLTDRIGLICDTVDPDGQIRPAIWRYVDDLRLCGATDRVFSFDPLLESLLFGDGEHGCIVPRGEAAVLLAPFVLSLCEEGNVPQGTMRFAEDGFQVLNTAAQRGAEAQTLEDAGSEFLRRLENPRKCASQSDYERAALETPGLRVSSAKAVAGYDPDEPAGRSTIPVVTMIALPYSSEAKPLPDEAFLESMRKHIESLRPICTKIKVIAPRYVPIGISFQLRTSEYDMEQQLREAIDDYLKISKTRAIGAAVFRNDIITCLMGLDGVYKVERLELRQLAAGSYMTVGGDMILPQNAIAYLSEMDAVIRN